MQQDREEVAASDEKRRVQGRGGRVEKDTNSSQSTASVLVDDDEGCVLSLLGPGHDLLELEGAALAER